MPRPLSINKVKRAQANSNGNGSAKKKKPTGAAPSSSSAAKDFNVELKHVRREFEPTEKTAGDHMLASSWRDNPAMTECLSKEAQFALSEVMHLSHATHIQEQAIPFFIQPGHSVIAEARTGSGKTLAFIIPLVERLMKQNQEYIIRNENNGGGGGGRPYLSRDICAFIVSPSRVLAQQTFIVGRTFSCRYPFGIKFMLVDRHVEALEKTSERLAKVARGGGFVAVGTVNDIAALQELLEERRRTSGGGQEKEDDSDDHDEEEESDDDDDDDGLDDDEELREMMRQRRQQQKEKARQQKRIQQKHQQQKQQPEQQLPTFAPLPRGPNDTSRNPFLFIVDEADVVLRCAQSYAKLKEMVRIILNNTTSSSSSTSQQQQDVSVDFGLFGATATSAPEVGRFASEIQNSLLQLMANKKKTKKTAASSPSLSTEVRTLQLSALGLESDASDLRNLFVMCEPQHMLQSFVHILNAHHTKKHFVFFNNVAVLTFVHRLLISLSQGVRPLLNHTASSSSSTSSHNNNHHIFELHEGMKDSVRFDQFGKFVRHNDADGGGAIMLCTDEAAFGLDVRDVDYVVHFEAPPTLQRFVHRAGRVARMGMTGTSVLLLPENDSAKAFLDEAKKMFSSFEKSHFGVGGAPLTARINAFVQEIRSGTVEAQLQNIVNATSDLTLPARRSRVVEEQQELFAQQNARLGKALASSSSGGAASHSTSDHSHHSGGGGGVTIDVGAGARMLSQAVAAMSTGGLFTKEEAFGALTAAA